MKLIFLFVSTTSSDIRSLAFSSLALNPGDYPWKDGTSPREPWTHAYDPSLMATARTGGTHEVQDDAHFTPSSVSSHGRRSHQPPASHLIDSDSLISLSLSLSLSHRVAEDKRHFRS